MTVIDAPRPPTAARRRDRLDEPARRRPVHDARWALAPEGTDPRVVAWVEKMAHLTTPDTVVWCDGSRREQDELLRGLVASGTLTRLNAEHRPYSFLARSHPDDVARVESRTFICSKNEADAGPTQQLGRADEDARDPRGPVRRARCAAAPCTSCRSRWARSAARSPGSACRSPTRPTSSSAWAS